MSDEELTFYASAALSGIDPVKFIRTSDELEMAFLTLVANKAIELSDLRQRNQAAHIINALAGSLEKGHRQKSGNSTATRTR